MIGELATVLSAAGTAAAAKKLTAAAALTAEITAAKSPDVGQFIRHARRNPQLSQM